MQIIQDSLQHYVKNAQPLRQQMNDAECVETTTTNKDRRPITKALYCAYIKKMHNIYLFRLPTISCSSLRGDQNIAL